MSNYSYLGCYVDKPDRSMPTQYQNGKYFTADQCYTAAKDAGAKYFGLQYHEGSGQNDAGQCFYGNAYKDYGNATSCLEYAPKQWVGSAWSNALYQITPQAPPPEPPPVSESQPPPQTQTQTQPQPEPEPVLKLNTAPEPQPQLAVDTNLQVQPTIQPQSTQQSNNMYLYIGIAALIAIIVAIIIVKRRQ